MKKLMFSFVLFFLGVSSLIFLAPSLGKPIFASHTGQRTVCSCNAHCNGLAPNNVCSIIAPVQNPCQVIVQNRNGVCGMCPNNEIGAIGGPQCGRFGPNYKCVAVSPQHNTCVAVAASPPPPPPPTNNGCAKPATDIMLVIDESHSMTNPNPSNMSRAKYAAKRFVDVIADSANDTQVPIKIGVASFNQRGQVQTNPLPVVLRREQIKNAIESLIPSGENGTCLECALDHPTGTADVMNAFAGGGNVKRVVVILTDGNITRWVNPGSNCDHDICGGASPQEQQTARTHAKQAAQRLRDRFNNGVQFWVIQFGNGDNAQDFRDIANFGGPYGPGTWKHVTGTDWDPLYNEYARQIRGAYIYAQVQDRWTDAPHAGWTVRLSCSSGERYTQTNAAGTAKFFSVPSGSDYTITVLPPAGYGIPPPGSTSSHASVTEGVFVDEPFCSTATQDNFDECDQGSFLFHRLGTIIGRVFNDINSNGAKETGEDYDGIPNLQLTGRILGSPTLMTPQTTQGTNYSFPGLFYGQSYTLTYTNIPTGYKLIKPASGNQYFLSYFGSTCSIDPKDNNGQPSCANTSFNNVDFAITNSIPWLQTADFNVRNDQRGFDNPIQQNAAGTCGQVMMRNGNGNTPGILYTAGPNTFSPGSASTKNWVIANTAASPTLYNPGQKLKSSYDEMLATLARNEVNRRPLNSITTCTNLSDCRIASGLGGIESAAYIADDDVSLGSVTVQGGKKAVILVNGTVRITQNITVAPGSFLMVIAKGDIIVDESVGRPNNYLCAGNTAQLQTAEVQGIFITNSDFRLPGIPCTTPNALRYQLNIAGSIVTNADATGTGRLNNNRNLCGGNLQYPALTITPRLDFILNAPTYILRPSTSWQEVAP